MNMGNNEGGIRGARPAAGADTQRKKSYRSPKLVVYGNIGEITRAVGMNGNNDNGTPPIHMSQL